ncbi:acyl-CoA synthetase (AMP-forming)/AMP-acid ligase II [Saccharomonospora marina XMU15]|uniref:Acyl-CoA synthetase (AMP-forming)/AMP-acid ligase II n=1 Tax=Saccharomonospora marina XMU15 TaxID=882083 RepID=H5X1C9_9PSEU|nr:acyl-CoA synthetase (AMP-forming)/AMP-acid ligase II [Saccharomonospora marina XMU15]
MRVRYSERPITASHRAQDSVGSGRTKETAALGLVSEEASPVTDHVGRRGAAAVSGLLAESARVVDAESGRTLTGAGLLAEVRRAGDRLCALPEGVLFTRTAVELDGVLHYLGAFEAGRAIALIDPALDTQSLRSLVERFRPAAVLTPPPIAPPPGYTPRDGHWVRQQAECVLPHPELAVLLPTSGSTGTPKLVRLSRHAVLSNARAIAEVLDIAPGDVAPTTLPLHYSYGLSVLNSHLVAGATVVVERGGPLQRGFIDAVAAHGATSLAGVPHHYEMLHRIDFDPGRYPGLHTLTQAGGKLRTELVAHFHQVMSNAGGRMFVMYGQTEAAPRMATVPAERLGEKLGSAGVALPGGAFTIRRGDGEETTHPKIVGEVVYRGPNVMMGYADSEAELAHGDDMGGVLDTGDLGYLDEEQYLFITGRLKRIGSVFGNRVSLDDLEQAVRAGHTGIEVVAAVPADDKVVLFAQGAGKETCRAVSSDLADRLHLHVSGFDVRGVDTVPLLASGKVDYRKLERLVREES